MKKLKSVLMFKAVNYSGSSDNTPYDSDDQLVKSPSPSLTNELQEPVNLTPIESAQSPKSNAIDIKHVILPDEECESLEDSVEPGYKIDPVTRLPKFQKRPLSDTPITSTWTSPSSSASPSPEPSELELIGLTNKHTEENAKLQQVKQPDIGSPTRFGKHHKRRPTTIDVPGLTKSKTSPDGMIAKEDSGSKLIIIMVGLPATGKSFITNKLSRYLNYSLYYCKVFNVGNTRRRFAKEHGLSDQDSKFFDPTNPESNKLRDKWALDTLNELLDYLLEGNGSVAIFDATNTTSKRRRLVLEQIRKRDPHLKVLFLESICTNRNVVENNIKLKLFGPDYKGKDPRRSLKDFKERLANYLTAYEPIEDDEDVPYIKMIDVGKKVISYKIQGFLASQTVYYLLNFNLTDRQIWITRNGESQDNMLGKIGGDSHLTPRGLRYARALTKFIDDQREKFLNAQQLKTEKSDDDIKSKDDIVQSNKYDDDKSYHDFFVWTSMRARSIETSQYFNEDDYPIKQMKMLDELNAGEYEGMTYHDIQEKHPTEFAKRQKDKIRYRYPGIAGESYMDVINRLRPVITELERIQESVVIVTHRVVARALLGYYMNLSVDIISNLDVPLHCVYCLEPKPYGITWSLWEYNEDADTFFKVPESDLNTTTVQEVGLVYKERKYSVVPTAPPSADMGVSDFLNRRRASVSFSGSGVQVNNTKGKTASNSAPNTGHKLNGGMLINGGGTSISRSNNRNIPGLQQQSPMMKPSMLMRNSSLLKTEPEQTQKRNLSPKAALLRERFEIDKLNEKLSKIKADLSSQFSSKVKDTQKGNGTTGNIDDNDYIGPVTDIEPDEVFINRSQSHS